MSMRKRNSWSRRQRQTRLGFEALEARQLLAVLSGDGGQGGTTQSTPLTERLNLVRFQWENFSIPDEFQILHQGMRIAGDVGLQSGGDAGSTVVVANGSSDELTEGDRPAARHRVEFYRRGPALRIKCFRPAGRRPKVMNSGTQYFKSNINSPNAPVWNKVDNIQGVNIVSARDYGIHTTGEIFTDAAAAAGVTITSTGAALAQGTAPPSSSHDAGRGTY